MKKTAWVFPGQGSQFVGMGLDLYETFQEARAVFEAADDALEGKLSELCFHGPESELTDTVNAQPAILVHSIAALTVLKAALGPTLKPAELVAGHSLGEYSALVAAGVIEFADAVKLVRARGLAMKRAGDRRPGRMAAILGLDEAALIEVCAEAGSVQIANLNAPGQIVISGEKEAVDRALVLAKSAGAKRAISLAVSIAAHSELMRSAVDEYTPAVNAISIKSMQIPVVSNVNAKPMENESAVRAEMLAQLTSPVQWVASVEYMRANGVDEFLEIGPKDVLAGLIRRILPGAQALSLGDGGAINALREGAHA